MFHKVVKELQSKVVDVKRERTDQEASLAGVKALDTMMSRSPESPLTAAAPLNITLIGGKHC